MPHRLLDDLDDLAPPPPNLVRFCGAPNCRRRARTGGRHCTICHAAAVRRWRDDHRTELSVRRRDAASLRDEKTRARDSARAKLAMAIRRGKIAPDRCQFCGSVDVIGIMADPAAPLDVRWVCRADRQAEVERRRADEVRSAVAAAQSGWERDRSQVLAAIALLPPTIVAELQATASCGPVGMRLSPEAPLYVMQLVRAYKARLNRSP